MSGIGLAEGTCCDWAENIAIAKNGRVVSVFIARILLRFDLGYDNAMNVKRDSAKDVTGDFETFKDFARQVLSVPHSEVKAQLDAEKAAKRTPKAPASRVSVSRAKPA